jgi:hypothetical protein
MVRQSYLEFGRSAIANDSRRQSTTQHWLHDLLKPHVSRLVVCDPRKNALMRDGNQNDRVDARNLAELLRT